MDLSAKESSAADCKRHKAAYSHPLPRGTPLALGEPNSDVWRVFCGQWNNSRALDRGSARLAANIGQLLTGGMVSPVGCPWSPQMEESLPWSREHSCDMTETEEMTREAEGAHGQQWCSFRHISKAQVENGACSHSSSEVWWNEKETASNKGLGEHESFPQIYTCVFLPQFCKIIFAIVFRWQDSFSH